MKSRQSKLSLLRIYVCHPGPIVMVLVFFSYLLMHTVHHGHENTKYENIKFRPPLFPSPSAAKSEGASNKLKL